MSIKIMTHVWENSAAEGTALLMLLAIADHANDDGVCWPSLTTLAQRARVGLRQAKRLVSQLEALGELEIRRGAGRNQTSVYIVTGAAAVTPATRQKVSRMTPLREKGDIQRAEKVTSSAGKGDTAMSPDPLEPSLEPSIHSLARAAAPPPPPVTAKPPPAPAKPKAVIIYENLVKYPPDVVSEQAIVAAVGEDEPSLKRWGDVVTAWLLSGHRANNVRGMLDWYRDGIPSYKLQENGNGQPGRSAGRRAGPPAPVVARVYDPALEDEFN